jgi:hypothetical protein
VLVLSLLQQVSFLRSHPEFHGRLLHTRGAVPEYCLDVCSGAKIANCSSNERDQWRGTGGGVETLTGISGAAISTDVAIISFSVLLYQLLRR